MIVQQASLLNLINKNWANKFEFILDLRSSNIYIYTLTNIWLNHQVAPRPDIENIHEWREKKPQMSCCLKHHRTCSYDLKTHLHLQKGSLLTNGHRQLYRPTEEAKQKILMTQMAKRWRNSRQKLSRYYRVRKPASLASPLLKRLNSGIAFPFVHYCHPQLSAAF